MAKSIENYEGGAENLDLEDHLQAVAQSEHEIQLREFGDYIRGLSDELRSPPDGTWSSLYRTLGSGIRSFRELFMGTEESAVQPMVKSEKTGQASGACLQDSDAESWSVGNCTSCSSMKRPAVQDTAEWKLSEPVATIAPLNGNIQYRISAAPGRYECRVTGLCWESSTEVELEYHLSDWELVGEFLYDFQPCGPLLDITVISGQLTAVHLPHFLCLGSLPSSTDVVRVLHVEESGVSLEPCEVSRYRAKLLHPTFSPKGVLVRSGFPVKAHCEVLIYRTLTAHLTLHVYLLPWDAKLIESVQKQENSSVKIPKPRPDISLQMKNRFMLSTSCSSHIRPQTLKLRYTHGTPNFFEVYVKDAKDDFQLRLMSKEGESVWEADIRSAEYSRRLICGGVHFVDLHRKTLIQRVKLVEPIADDLYPKISEEKYSNITNAKTNQDKMRAVYDVLLSGGQTLKDVFLQSLQKNEPELVEELSQS